MMKSENIAEMEPNVAGEATPNKREATDRRSRPTPIVSRYWLRGLRRAGRRDSESKDIYIDRYSWGEWTLVITVLGLSLLDMLFTIQQLAIGGEEANPVMSWALQWGNTGFAVIKMAVTVLGLLVLLLHARFRRVRGLLNLALGVYSLLLCYHLYLKFGL